MTIGAGDRVRLEYVGRFEDGTVFATSNGNLAAEQGLTDGDAEPSPLSFTVGEGEVIEGLETGVVGLDVGDEETITVPPEDAYGEHDPERIREYDPETFEGMVGRPPDIGMHVEAENGLHGDVTAVSDTVQVDFNHELAGKTLVFEVRILDVE
jgi:FKBP-type peptidyl-prolyl cis-trans isomerase 2